MDFHTLIGAFAGLMAILSAGVVFYYFRTSRSQVDLRSLMGSGGSTMIGTVQEVRERIKSDETGKEYERIKSLTKKRKSKKVKLTMNERFFQAGIFSDKDKKEFARMRLLIPIFLAPIACVVLYTLTGAEFAIYGLILGALLGLQVPFSILDRKIASRGEEIMFYLPLVIEQIAIGVSSSLDIGPCLQRVVSMADERDSHNVVTELVRHAQFHVKSGVSLEDALNEIGRLSGHTELKHAFMSLSQVAKHGGEITRQLQELADAVSTQRETKIEAKIKKLELEATGPVALVFCGFLVILLIGFGIQIQGAFG